MKKALLSLLFSLPLLFYASGQYVVNGTAISTGGNCFRLTQALQGQGGSVWFQNKISLASDLTVDATVYLGNLDANGADGLAFVLQPVCSGLGGIGGGLGYLGISPSLAVELDTWQNADPPQDHIGLMKNGNVNHVNANASTLQGFNILPNIEDGLNHSLRIVWDAGAMNLKVYLDGILQINYTDDIVGNIFGGNRNVYWGFTAATGAAINEHRVCINASSFTEEGSFTVTKPTCPSYNNGAIDLNPAGGIGPFQYLWSNGATSEDLTGIAAGNYTVTVTDGNNCKSVFSIPVVNELDATPPVIVCPTDINVPNDPGQCGAIVNYPAVTATDNCCPVSLPGYNYYGTFGGHTYFTSNATLSWPDAKAAAEAAGGHLATITSAAENAFLSNNILYWIGLTDEVTEGTFTWVTGEPVSFTGWGPGEPNNSGNEDWVEINRGGPGRWNDLPVGNPRPFYVEFDCVNIQQTAGLPSGSVFPVGTTINTFVATDAAGNSSSCSFTVTVTDNEKPVPDAATLPTITGECAASATTPTATDNCAGVTTGTTTDPTSYMAQGSYTITWTYDDGNGNVETQLQTVIVKDVSKPVPDLATLPNVTGECAASATAPTATDNCAGLISGTTTDPTSYSAQGTYIITWTYDDGNGNVETQQQTVIVKDVTDPVAVCKSASVTLVGGVASISVADVEGGSFDNCGIQSITASPLNFNCSNIGDNNVTLTVTDIAGNVSTCTAVVTVIGEIPTCSIASIPSSNIYTGGVSTNLYLGYGAQSTTLEVSAPASGAPYTYAWSGGTLSNYNTANPMFTATTAGSFIFTVEVTNKYGCKTTCSITICVTDIRVPGTDGKKVYVCHIPAGNPGNPQTLSISVNAVPAHVGLHGGDKLGTCDMQPCTAPSIVSKKSAVAVEDIHEGLKVTVAPNPTNTHFTFRLHSENETPVSIRIVNGTGQVLESANKVNANGTIQMGSKLLNGMYFAEFMQGTDRQVIKVMKIGSR